MEGPKAYVPSKDAKEGKTMEVITEGEENGDKIKTTHSFNRETGSLVGTKKEVLFGKGVSIKQLVFDTPEAAAKWQEEQEKQSKLDELERKHREETEGVPTLPSSKTPSETIN